ncbi:MAG TPA: MATE family efflux transporter, partial [Microthrixaceae bacterium]|nr:MATE family efflux transporter [Microthrixaceae bacterium]
AAVDAAWLAVALGSAAAVVLALCGRWAIGALGGHGAVATTAWIYLRTSLFGLPAFTLLMAGVGTLRGRGDARTPLRVAAASVTANLAIEALLIYGLGYGVGASALGTVIAKWGAAATTIALVAAWERQHGASWRPTRRVRELAVVGRDLLVRTTLLIATLTAASALAAHRGAVTLAAHSVVASVWMFSAYVNDGLEVAAQSLVAHEIGAGRSDGAVAVARRILWWSARLGLSLAVVVAVTRSPLAALFTDDPAVRAAAATPLWIVAAIQPLNSIAFALDGILVGWERVRVLATIMAVATAAFALTAGTAPSLVRIWLGIAAMMVVRAGAASWWFRRSARAT